jgi:hypothetical protein
MDYKGKYLDIKSGDVILFRSEFVWKQPVTWLSVLVRFFTKCYYNHCGIIIKNWGVPFVNESLAKGVVTRPLQEHIVRSKTKILIIRPKWNFEEKMMCVRSNSMLGEKYGFSTLLFYQLFYRITGKWIGRAKEAAEKDGMVCSEYVAWCFNLNKWWLYSAKELLNSGMFKVVYKES